MKGFRLDLNRCTGCHACRLACTIENGLEDGESWRQVYTFNPQRRPGLPAFHLSLGCQHCADPACLTACPARAYSRDPNTGAVLVDEGLCIGCRYCNWACPFDAPRYSRSGGTISKCTFCNTRLLEGREPACTSLCPTGALQYADLEPETGAPEVPGFPPTRLSPSIRFTPLRLPGTGPELSSLQDATGPGRASAGADLTAPRKISLMSESPLVLFTMIAAVLVAACGAAVAGALRVDPLAFLTAAVGALGVSALHLGRWERALRAVLNLRGSWLSREVVAYSLFVVLSAGFFLAPHRGLLLGWPAFLAGFFTLFCVDRVYGSVSARGSGWSHSAGAMLTGIFLSGVFMGSVSVAGTSGLLKLILYADRRPWSGSGRRLTASVLRLGLGFVAPLALWQAYPEWVLPAVLAGEVIDRCQFYLDLEIATPSRQVAADLRRELLFR